MSFTVKIDGGDSFEIARECVERIKIKTDLPEDSNARTKDVGTTVLISGKILAAVDGDPFDSTRQLGLWSLVPAEKAECYRKVTIEHVAAGQVVRKYYLPNAFVVDYKEKFGDTEGVGSFELLIKQKKDKLANVTVEGGYSL